MFENQNVDNIGQVAEGTVERAGLNILGLVTSLANQQLDTEIRSEVIAIMVIIIISICIIFPRFSAPTFLLVLYAAPSSALLLLTEAIFFRRFLKKYPAELLLNFHLHSQVSRNLSRN